MTHTGDVHKRRGANAMKTGLAMLVLGIAVALAFSFGQEEPSPIAGWAAFVAFAGFIVALVGLGKWRERPASD